MTTEIIDLRGMTPILPLIVPPLFAFGAAYFTVETWRDRAGFWFTFMAIYFAVWGVFG